jgi:hypothetical protein
LPLDLQAAEAFFGDVPAGLAGRQIEFSFDGAAVALDPDSADRSQC